MNKRKILIDTDPGIDDAFALLAAMAHDDFEILGIMPVAGNKSLPVVTPNALRLVDFMGKDIPVVEGAKACLKKLESYVEQENEGADCHGIDGMGDSGLTYTERCLVKEKAWDFMLNKIKEYPYEIELVTLGPLTNVALAIQKDKETMKKLKSITVMGGSFVRAGNTTDYAEYNIWFDAEAAEITVSELGKDVPITFVGLDATHSCLISHDFIDFISYEGGQRGILLEKISRHYIKSYYTQTGVIGAIIHDLYTMLSVIDPSIIKEVRKEKVKVLLDEEHYGQTAFHEDGNVVTAVMSFDNDALKKLWLNLMLEGKEELIEKFYPQLA